MKKIAILISICIQTVSVLAQTETLDITTYSSPKGWNKEVKENYVSYTFINKKDKSWCRIGVYKSTASKGSIEDDFQSEWQQLVATPYNITEIPQPNEAEQGGGWEVKSGGGKFIFNNANAIALLTTYSGFNRVVSIVATTNAQRYIADIEKFVGTIELKKPENTISVSNNPIQETVSNDSSTSISNDYAFSTTNFTEGWDATIKNDWVQLTKSSTTVLLHFGIPMTDEMRMDEVNSCWNLLASSRYQVKQFYNRPYSVLKDFPYYFLQADAIEISTGKNVFVSFQAIIKNGTAYCYEIITASQNEFQEQFPTMDSIENTSNFNKFAIGKNDLIGTWQEGGGAFTQYYYVSNGNYAGMNITVSNLKYIFLDNSNYRTDVKAVSNNTYATEKEVGKYSMSEWQVITTDQTGKTTNYSAWFTATKGGRILHLARVNGSEHFQLGKVH